jgi:hypothetical protein
MKTNMKIKIFAVLLVFIIVIGTTACGGSAPAPAPAPAATAGGSSEESSYNTEELDNVYNGLFDYDTSSYNEEEITSWYDITDRADEAYNQGNLETLYGVADELYTLDNSVRTRIEDEKSSNSPFKGEFDMTTGAGYSYHVEYAMIGLLSVEVDTTIGAPGTLGIVLSRPTLNLTITNTTPGKKAPSPYLGIMHLVYPDGQLSNFFNSIPEDQNKDGRKKYGGKSSLSWEPDQIFSYLNPPQANIVLRTLDEFRSGLVTYGEGSRYEYLDFFYWELKLDNWGLQLGDDEFGVGESRERELSAASLLTVDSILTFIIPEEDKDMFIETYTENIAGIAITDGYGVVGYSEGISFCPVSYISAAGYTVGEQG